MKYIITIGLLFAFLIVNAQKVGEIVLKTGKKIELYNKINRKGNVIKGKYNGQTIYYYGKDGRSRSINHSKVESMKTVDGDYISLPIYIMKAKRLHRVVAESDKYLLTDYYSINRFQFYIFDKSTMKAVEKLKFQTYRPKKDIKLIDIVREYFSDCPELMTKIQSNFDNFYGNKNYKKLMNTSKYGSTREPRSILFENIFNFNCK